MKKGQILESGFKILDTVKLPEYQSKGVWAIHERSGAEVFHLFNDDKENFFSFIFATPSEETGETAHILEHMVFCGSKSYPFKDPYNLLEMGSLKTSLNAETSFLTTNYFASSTNEHDYFNIMSVSADAAFNPLLEEWAFMQEGYRFYFVPTKKSKSGSLQINGVVWNEIKNRLSNNIYIFYNNCVVKSMLSDSSDEFEYGENRSCILDVNWNSVKEYHRLWYRPANCRIFLYGNIPTEKQLCFINDRILSSVQQSIPLAPPERMESLSKKRSVNTKSVKLSVPCVKTIICPEDEPQGIIISWFCGYSTNIKEKLDFDLLKEIITRKENSVFFKRLLEYDLISDVFSLPGAINRNSELIFSIMAEIDFDSQKQCMEEAAKYAEGIIFKELKLLLKEGISKDILKTIIYEMEFDNRAIWRTAYPFSYTLMERSLKSWQYDKKPWDSLFFVRPFGDFKKRVNNLYIKKLIKNYLLNNHRRILTVIEPKKGLENRDIIKDRLYKMKKAMSQEDKEAVRSKLEWFKKIQEQEDDPGLSAAIPHLSLKELDPDMEFIKRECTDISGAPVVLNPVFTNGITYIHLLFPLDVFDAEDYIWFPLFACAITASGVPGLSCEDVKKLLKRNTGGFYAECETCASLSGNAKSDIQGRDWLTFSLATLDENIGPALHLASMIIKEADFSGLEKILSASGIDIDADGCYYARVFSEHLISRNAGITELWTGMNQYAFARELKEKSQGESIATQKNETETDNNIDVSKAAVNNTLSESSAGSFAGDTEVRKLQPDSSKISEGSPLNKLKEIQNKLLNSGVVINIIGNNINKTIKEVKKHFGSFGSPKPKNIKTKYWRFFNADIKACYSYPKNNIFFHYGALSGACAISFKASPCGSVLHPAEHVLGHLLSKGVFYENIRLKGGAYSVEVIPNNLMGVFSIVTDKDPDPLGSLNFITDFFKNVSADTLIKDKSVLERAIIGTYAQHIPQTPEEMGCHDFYNYLNGIEKSHILKRRKGIINVTPDQIDAALKRFAAQLAGASSHIYPVIIAEEKIARKAANKTGVKAGYVGEAFEL